MDTPSSSSPSLPVMVVSDRAITEKASYDLGVARKEKTKMKRSYQPQDNYIYGCNFCICKIKFPTLKGLRDHLTKHHQTDLMLERMNGTGPCPEWPSPYHHYQYNLNNFICRTSSNCNKYLETSLEPSKLNGPVGSSSSSSGTANPSFNGGVTDMSMTVNPSGSLTIYASSSKGPLPSSNNCKMSDNHVGLSSGPFESTRSGSTSSTNPRFHGESPGFRYSYLKNFLSFSYAWRDVHDLELSLGASKSKGDNNNALNDGVTIGMNMPLRPRVSRFHYANGNPLDSTIPFNDLSCVKENVSGSSSYSENHITKGKNKIMVDDDDGKDIVVVEDNDDDMDVLVIEDDDAKSWGLDLSLSH